MALALRPFPQFTNINDVGQPTGKRSYDVVHMKVQRRPSQGLNSLVSYTLSKTLTNTGQEGYTTWAATALDTYNRSLAKTIAPGDIPNVLSIS